MIGIILSPRDYRQIFSMTELSQKNVDIVNSPYHTFSHKNQSRIN